MRLIAVECLILDTAIERLIGGQIVVSMRNDKGFLVTWKWKDERTYHKEKILYNKKMDGWITCFRPVCHMFILNDWYLLFRRISIGYFDTNFEKSHWEYFSPPSGNGKWEVINFLIG